MKEVNLDPFYHFEKFLNGLLYLSKTRTLQLVSTPNFFSTSLICSESKLEIVKFTLSSQSWNWTMFAVIVESCSVSASSSTICCISDANSSFITTSLATWMVYGATLWCTGWGPFPLANITENVTFSLVFNSLISGLNPRFHPRLLFNLEYLRHAHFSQFWIKIAKQLLSCQWLFPL